MFLAALVVLAVFLTAAGVVRVSAIRGDGNYYVNQTLADERGWYLSSEGLGTWYGRGLERLGLKLGAHVLPDVFKRLMLGFGQNGEPLVQNAGAKKWNAGEKKRRAGTELNFSTSKHFDVLYALANNEERAKLRALFQRSVEAVLDHIQREHAWCKRGHDGKRSERCDLSIALFFHETNRAGEPFLHCHAVVLGVAARLDGTTGAIDHGPLYHVQRLASVLFDLHLVRGLREEFGICALRNGYSFRVPGVPQSLTEFWSSRKRQIDARLKKTGDAKTPKNAEEAAKKTRQEKRSWDRAERRARWATEASTHGIDIGEVLRRGRTVRALTPDVEAARAEEAVRGAAEALLRDVDAFTRKELVIKAGVRCLDQGVAVETLLATIDRALADPLGHNLRAAGTKRGEPVFHYWDPPEPKPAAYIPKPPTAEPSTKVPRPGDDEVRPAPKVDNGHPPERERRPSPGRRTHASTARPSAADEGSFGSRAEPSLPEWASEFATIQTLAERLLTEPVRAWLLVRKVANALVATYGHFTLEELTTSAAKQGGRHVSDGQIVLAAGRLLAHPLVTGFVQTGERNGAAVFTSRAHERAELKFLREAGRLAERRGRKVGKRILDGAAVRLLAKGEEFVRALRGLVHPKSRLGLLDCPSGDGRAKLLYELGRVYEESGFRVRFAAPTGASVESLTRQTGKPASTVHRIIQDASTATLWTVLKWLRLRGPGPLGSKLKAAENIRKPFDKLTKKDVVVVDDAHLLGTREGAELFALARRAGAKVILIGDSARAPGVFAGGGFRHLTDRHRTHRVKPEVKLDRAESIAAFLLRHGNAFGAVKTLEREGRLWRETSYDEAAKWLLERYGKNGGLLEPARHLVVTSTNREAAKLNKRIQRERKERGLLGIAAVRLPDGSWARSGDRVVFTRSSFHLGVKTGHSGTVVSVNPILKTATVSLDRGGRVSVSVTRFPHLALGYASSVPRASELAPARIYALARGGGFFKQSVLALLEQATGRVDLFTTLRNDRLTELLTRDGSKTFAVSHRTDLTQQQDPGQAQSLHQELRP